MAHVPRGRVSLHLYIYIYVCLQICPPPPRNLKKHGDGHLHLEALVSLYLVFTNLVWLV